MTRDTGSLPPVIILGGDPNALSVARNLGRRGIRVFAVNEPDAPVRYSRYCQWLPTPWLGSNTASWTSYLLGAQAEALRGAVLLAASDEALEILINNRNELAKRYLLDDSNLEAQRLMLDKLSTYKIAQAAGVPIPRYWVAGYIQQLEDIAADVVYPILVRPLSSYRFGTKFGGKKFFVAHAFDELRDGVAKATAAGVEVMLVEQIPGLDDRLCSYYTYLDADGTPLFDFAKRVIRRFPVGMGNGCYHITDQVPGVKELSVRLFREAGLRGLANAEFKLDERDGQLKLIECNARFTAADCLVTQSGFDLASFVYDRLVGLPLTPLQKYQSGMRLWYPLQDFWAFVELRRQGKLTLWGWLRSLLHHKTLPYWQWGDPLPSIVRGARRWKLDRVHNGLRALGRKIRNIQQASPASAAGLDVDSGVVPSVTRDLPTSEVYGVK
jgi:D-aspartate ligase